MTQDSNARHYEDLAFEAFVKVLSDTSSVPAAIPEGFDNLNKDELQVLGYLLKRSSERFSSNDENGAAAPANTPVNDENAALSENDCLPLNKESKTDAASAFKDTVEPEKKADSADSVSANAQSVMPAVPNDIDDIAFTEPPSDSTISDKTESGPGSVTHTTRESQPGEISECGVDDLIADAEIGAAIAPAVATEPVEEEPLNKGPGGLLNTRSVSSNPDPDRINLKNGHAKKPYETSIQGYSDIVLIDDGGSALIISPAGEVSGEDITAGEYTLILEASKADRPVRIRARLSIIADPRDLWKTIESDQNAPLAKPDEAFEQQSAEAFIVAASKRGRSHANEGKYRDDHFCIQADTDTGWHLLIVADGAGSAELSREGSKIACEKVISALPDMLAETVTPKLEAMIDEHDQNPDAWAIKVRKEILMPVLPKVALTAAQAIESTAEGMKRKAQDFSTTIVIALSKNILGKWFTASFTVGDGGVAIYDADANQVAVLCRPDSGEFAGQTRFLTTSEFADPEDVLGRVFVDLRAHFTVLAAMTDGITDPKFPTDSVFAKPDVWSEFWTEDICKEVTFNPDNPDIETQMLGWLDFWSRGNHDDRTIALMLPEPQFITDQVDDATRIENSLQVDDDPVSSSNDSEPSVGDTENPQ